MSDSFERILVTGATGKTGSALISQLLAAGVDVSALVRSVSETKLPAQCRIIEGDLADPESLIQALHNQDAAFLLLPFSEDMVAWGTQFVDLARQAGLRAIVKLSAWDAAIDHASAMAALHGQVDKHLIDADIDQVILRCNSFMENITHLYGAAIRKRRLIAAPEGDGRSAFISVADIAAAATQIFQHWPDHRNHEYELTGNALFSNTDVAGLLTELLREQDKITAQQAIVYRDLAPEQAAKLYQQFGLSQWRIEVLLSLSAYLRDGGMARITDDFLQITGEKPTTLKQFLHEHIDVFN